MTYLSAFAAAAMLAAAAGSAHAGAAGTIAAVQANGAYQPVSRTAEAFTGSVKLSSTGLTAANGLAYRTRPAGRTTAGRLATRDGTTFADLLIVDAAAPVEIRRVTGETAPKRSRNGGFCSPGRTTYLALAQVNGDLRIAAFQGSAAPGAGAGARAVCGTFNYAR